ncbi:NUDIX hydrolase [Ancylobacter sp. 6x-1]|uniref:NUDIX hydrolase n=1 Tax=Ancylobacter crimeensis TaxID=2579147 RepID=A0ABT0D9B8_9HYPH|nr:NUDIX hydrolase [Ancylobacter crimeensis]MCK0196535.1 NUDIX hydrolase [Ancylobacter crimeensis]
MKSKLQKAAAQGGRRQVAALPYRLDANGKVEVLVLSSRETRRAVIPKGWPMRNVKDWKAAQIEARQEAGAVGSVSRKKFGEYEYWKRLEQIFLLVKVAVYPMKVTRQLADWPERHERSQQWLPARDAALLVEELDLSSLIVDFAERLEHGKKEPSPGSGKHKRSSKLRKTNAEKRDLQTS